MKRLLLAGLVVASLSGTAIAQEAGDWLLRAGPYGVQPKSDNSDIANVDDGYALGFNFTYFMSDAWALELLAATPFSHDIELAADGSKVGETKHLPPTFSVQYHFPLDGAFQPYVGVGLNYTYFFDEKTTGALEGADLKLDGSFGLAAQIGADFDLNEKWTIGADIRWIDINTDASLDGIELTEVEIDPLVWGITLGYRF